MELERYDRQIRAWGFKTQERLKRCRFLIYELCSASLECMKNLILAGASSIHVVDSSKKIDEFGNYILFLKNLNPYCPLRIIDGNIDFNDYDFICLFGDDNELLKRMIQSQKACLFCHGLFAYLFFNIGVDDLVIDEQQNDNTIIDETITGSLISQLIVDHLPPIDKTILLYMKFNNENLSTIVEVLK